MRSRLPPGAALLLGERLQYRSQTSGASLKVILSAARRLPVRQILLTGRKEEPRTLCRPGQVESKNIRAEERVGSEAGVTGAAGALESGDDPDLFPSTPEPGLPVSCLSCF